MVKATAAPALSKSASLSEKTPLSLPGTAMESFIYDHYSGISP